MQRLKLFIFVAAIIPSSTALAEASAERGRDVFWRLCISCHAIGCNRDDSAPMLKGVVGRKAGTVPGLPRQSDALRNSGITWTEELLDVFLANPRAMIPGIKGKTRTDIGIVNVKNEQERKDVLAFIKSGDTSLDICPK